MPIFGLSCNLAECHRGTAKTRQLHLGPACSFDTTTRSCSFDPGALDAEVLDTVHANLMAPSGRSPDLPIVAPGDPERSFLLHKLGGCPDFAAAHAPCSPSCGDVMPPGQSLEAASPERFAVIARWVAAGAPRR